MMFTSVILSEACGSAATERESKDPYSLNYAGAASGNSPEVPGTFRARPPRQSSADAFPVPLLVSFSGIDGAGKTTQIERLVVSLDHAGLRVRLVRFWDDIACLRNFRETIGCVLFKGDRGVGSRDKPVRRRDKNVMNWYMVPVRMALCFFDALRLAAKVSLIRRGQHAEVVIFDRYLYDQLANLEMNSRVVRTYVRLILALAPRPALAYLLDADPAEARARKPEYPLEFLRSNRNHYLVLGAIAGMDTIPPGSVDEVGSEIRIVFAKKLGSVHGGLRREEPMQSEAIRPS